MINEAPKSEIFVTAKTIPISYHEYYCIQGMKLHWRVNIIFLSTNYLKHYLTKVPLLRMINEAPKNEIFVPAKNNLN
jgi:hypothetical protein